MRVRKFNSWSLFLVKIIGTTLSVASALAVGMEGPLVHIGAIVGASCSNLSGILNRNLTRPLSFLEQHHDDDDNNEENDSYFRLTSIKFFQRLWLWNSTDLAHFANDAERRDLISIGAACGL